MKWADGVIIKHFRVLLSCRFRINEHCGGESRDGDAAYISRNGNKRTKITKKVEGSKQRKGNDAVRNAPKQHCEGCFREIQGQDNEKIKRISKRCRKQNPVEVDSSFPSEVEPYTTADRVNHDHGPAICRPRRGTERGTGRANKLVSHSAAKGVLELAFTQPSRSTSAALSVVIENSSKVCAREPASVTHKVRKIPV